MLLTNAISSGLERMCPLSDYERGLLEAKRRDDAERAAERQGSIDEYDAKKRAPSEPGAVVGIEDQTALVPKGS